MNFMDFYQLISIDQFNNSLAWVRMTHFYKQFSMYQNDGLLSIVQYGSEWQAFINSLPWVRMMDFYQQFSMWVRMMDFYPHFIMGQYNGLLSTVQHGSIDFYQQFKMIAFYQQFCICQYVGRLSTVQHGSEWWTFINSFNIIGQVQFVSSVRGSC